MKLAIVGGRDFDNFGLLLDTILNYFWDELNKKFTFDSIISGGAKGADALGYIFACDYDIEYIGFPAQWDLYGKSAGFIRNQEIVDTCDIVLAFWDGKSKGTKHTIDLATRAKKPTFIVYY